MSLTSSALQIGKSALIAYQQALQIAGNNIANAGNPNYSRQIGRFDPRSGVNVSGIQIGGGVQITSIQRRVQESLEQRLRFATADRESASAKSDALARIETQLDALGDSNLGTAITNLFRAFTNVQNNPEDAAARSLVVSRAETVVDSISKTRADLISLRDDLNDDVTQLTSRADQITTQIADLNIQITAAEAGGGGSSGPLRDQRGALLQELSGLIQIQTREQPNGAVNVYIGNESLVQFGQSRGLKTTLEPAGTGLYSVVVRFADNSGLADARAGQIAGAIDARDNGTAAQLTRLNTLATGLIQEVNRRHAGGQGLSGFSTLVGTYAVGDPNAALNTSAAGLALAPKSGSFFIDVKDTATGGSKRCQITIDLDGLNGDDTTLTSLAAQINAQTAGEVTATVQPDGRLSLSAATGKTFTFADDRSNVLASLGLNTFFSGADASDIAVNSIISASPALIAAASNGHAGDGGNAGLLAGAADAAVTLLGGASLRQYYQASVSQASVDANATQNTLDAAVTVLGALQAQRESVSGVNLDEEAVRLVTYQRAYQGAARYLSVVDEMLTTLLSIVK